MIKKVSFYYIASIFLLLLGTTACEDAPSGPPPFEYREFIAPDTIIDTWVGGVMWSGADSLDEFEIEFVVDSQPAKDPNDSTKTINLPYFRTNTLYFNYELSEWELVTGDWFLFEEQTQLRWQPNSVTQSMLYVGYFNADSLYGFVTTVGGQEGRWSLHRKKISGGEVTE